MTQLAPVYILCAHGERRAADALAEIGVTGWAPTFTKLKQGFRQRVKRTVETPLIPGYVFARLKPEDFAAALSQERIHGVLCRDGTPVPVPEAEWTKILLMVMSGRFDEAAPATKARPRGNRRRAAQKLQEFCDALKASQLKSLANHGSVTIGGEPVSEDTASSRRSTRSARRPAWTKLRSVA